MSTIQPLEEGKFLLKGTTPVMANTIRRAVMELVPTMAIETVEIEQNTSIMYDEMLAHRLGLVPLTTDLKSYKTIAETDGVEDNRSSLKLSLKAKGPCTVYAKELKSKDPKVKPAYPDMPIVVLLKGQELELVATAILDTGKAHTKFRPANVWYNYQVKNVTVNNGHAQLAEFKDKYPKQVFSKDGKIDKKLIEEKELYDAVAGINPEIVNVEYDETNIVFEIESFGQLNPKEIIQTALAKLQERFEEFESKLG